MRINILHIFSFFIVLSLIISCRESISEPPSDPAIDEKPFVASLKEFQIPSERVIWISGNQYEIKWTVTQNLDKINIVLLKKFSQVAQITRSTENDGSFIWSIPQDLPGSHHYRIRLISPYNYSATATSVEFEIENQLYTPLEDK